MYLAVLYSYYVVYNYDVIVLLYYFHFLLRHLKHHSILVCLKWWFCWCFGRHWAPNTARIWYLPKLPGQQPSSKVDFCARSVIGGDPNLDTEQVGVPRCIWTEMVEMGIGKTVCMYWKKKGKLEGNLENRYTFICFICMVYSCNMLMFFCLFVLVLEASNTKTLFRSKPELFGYR